MVHYLKFIPMSVTSVSSYDGNTKNFADGDIGTHSCLNKNGYVIFQYPEPVAASHVRITSSHYRDGWIENVPKLLIQISNNSNNWTDTLAVNSNPGLGGRAASATLPIESHLPTTYYRYYNSGGMVCIAEIEFVYENKLWTEFVKKSQRLSLLSICFIEVS